jgi:hypothetical protein
MLRYATPEQSLPSTPSNLANLERSDWYPSMRTALEALKAEKRGTDM